MRCTHGNVQKEMADNNKGANRGVRGKAAEMFKRNWKKNTRATGGGRVGHTGTCYCAAVVGRGYIGDAAKNTEKAVVMSCKRSAAIEENIHVIGDRPRDTPQLL